MLRDLRVQQFALFDDIRITFGPRLNVLTGETGAGKSLVMDAVTMVRGGRASPDFVRSGSEEAVVEASFTVNAGSQAAAELAAMGYPADDDLVVQRVLSASGKGRVYVNGRPMSVTMLAQVTGSLIDVHSQHEHQSLTRSETPLAILDAYARLDGARRAYHEAWTAWSALDQALASRATRETTRRREIALLAHDVEELTRAHVGPTEWDDLERERTVLRHAGRLHDAARAVHSRLQEQDGGILESVGTIAAELGSVGAIAPKLAEAAGLAESALMQLHEIAGAVRGYAEGVDHDEGRLDAIESRLSELQRLRRKYDVAVNELPAILEQKRSHLLELERSEAADDNLGPQASAARRRVEALADALHLGRLDASAKAETLIDSELTRLGMSARFHVEITPIGEEGTLGPNGRDRVDFLIRTNPGEPEKPLRKIASGGELSRVMLALKSVLASVDSVPTLVFDEADAGVGGAVAEVVGRRLRAIADHRQVLCVTHLPQVASGADAHFFVEKSVDRGRTNTTVRQLTDRGRVREVARMLAGQRITATAIRHAEEMIRLVSLPSYQQGVGESTARPATVAPRKAGM